MQYLFQKLVLSEHLSLSIWFYINFQMRIKYPNYCFLSFQKSFYTLSKLLLIFRYIFRYIFWYIFRYIFRYNFGTFSVHFSLQNTIHFSVRFLVHFRYIFSYFLRYGDPDLCSNKLTYSLRWTLTSTSFQKLQEKSQFVVFKIIFRDYHAPIKNR